MHECWQWKKKHFVNSRCSINIVPTFFALTSKLKTKQMFWNRRFFVKIFIFVKISKELEHIKTLCNFAFISTLFGMKNIYLIYLILPDKSGPNLPWWLPVKYTTKFPFYHNFDWFNSYFTIENNNKIASKMHFFLPRWLMHFIQCFLLSFDSL